MKRIQFLTGDLNKIQLLVLPLNKGHPNRETSRALNRKEKVGFNLGLGKWRKIF